MRSKLVFLYVESWFDVPKSNLPWKIITENVDCFSTYFRGGHKNNLRLKLRRSFKVTNFVNVQINKKKSSLSYDEYLFFSIFDPWPPNFFLSPKIFISFFFDIMSEVVELANANFQQIERRLPAVEQPGLITINTAFILKYQCGGNYLYCNFKLQDRSADKMFWKWVSLKNRQNLGKIPKKCLCLAQNICQAQETHPNHYPQCMYTEFQIRLT